MPRVIGITGTFGSGKSTVGKILQSLGAVLIDSDEIVHQLLDEDVTVKSPIESRFGAEVLDNDGDIDRRALAAIVFSDDEARKDLESIVHPHVFYKVKELIKANENEKLIAVLVPLLFETKSEHIFDEVWSVHTDEQQILDRLPKDGKFSKQDAQLRMNAQWTQAQKEDMADVVIDNTGIIENTTAQINKLLEET